jgi:hypothetical protein
VAGSELNALELERGQFLVEQDFLLCRSIVEHLTHQRNPAVQLYGANAFLARYYAGILSRVMGATGSRVSYCSPSLSLDLPSFLSVVLAEKTVGEATLAATVPLHMLVFRHCSRIRYEEFVLLREMQRSFVGLGLGFLFVGEGGSAPEGMIQAFTLDGALQPERRQFAVQNMAKQHWKYRSRRLTCISASPPPE